MPAPFFVGPAACGLEAYCKRLVVFPLLVAKPTRRSRKAALDWTGARIMGASMEDVMQDEQQPIVEQDDAIDDDTVEQETDEAETAEEQDEDAEDAFDEEEDEGETEDEA